ncbi:MAG: S8 family serine peptidase [Ardenticatenaceae bacterium]|nr:S8 family serine peptidase [Ardenticatenaceae bacterium]
MNQKSRLFSILTIVTVLALLMALVFSLAGAKPSFAEEGSSGNAVSFESQSAVPVNAAQVVEPKGATGAANYIIQLQDPPVASYEGGIAGLAATNPSVNGMADLRTTEATTAYANYLQGVQADFATAVADVLSREVTVSDTFQYAFNGLVVNMTSEEAAKVAALNGVKKVYRETIENVLTDVGPTWIGADGIWDGSATGVATMGEGVVVAVLDTGVNSDHPSFADVGGDGYDHTNPLGSGNYFGVCDSANPDYQPGFVCNDKLIGVHDFIDGDGNDPNSPEDGDGHGSHTSSTVAGNVVTATIYGPTTSLTKTISGVAPHANIIMYDVCLNGPSSEGGGCPGTALLAAAEQVVLDHADLIDAGHAGGIAAINYSISGGADPYNDAVEQAFLAATDAGVFVSASAGNEGPGASTVAHVSPWVSTVAASTHNRKIINSLVNITSDDDSLADIVSVGFTSGYGPAPIVYAGDYPNPNDPGGDPAQCLEPYPAGTFSGQIVVCDRGTIARVDKGANVLAGGAGGFVLANVAAQGEAVVGDAHYLPGIHIGVTDGDALRAWIADNVNDNPVATITGYSYDVDPANADIMADFSSRGPVLSLDVLKPDVTAPGVSIWAAVNNDDPGTPDGFDEYGFLSGTSMSSPHNAGAAALMTALYPDWTPHQIKSAMMMTAVPDSSVKEDGVTPTDPFDVGSGRLALGDAANAGFVLDETTANFEDADPSLGGDPTTLNLANFSNRQCLQNCTWTRMLESTQATTVTWTATATGPFTVTVEPATFDLAPGAMQMITVTADVTGMPADAWAFAEVTLAPAGPIVEGFEDGILPPTGWMTYTSDAADPGWQIGTVAANNDPHSGTYQAFKNDDNLSADGDAWLITPQFTPDANTSVNFWQSDYFQTYYNYHGVWVSNGSANPADGDYVEVWTADTTATWEEISVDLSAYAGTPIYVGFKYTGDFDDEWYLDDIMIGDPLAPVVDAVPAHFPVTVVPSTGVLPDEVNINARRNAGSYLVSGIESIEITDLTVDVIGLTQATNTNFSLYEDPTNGIPEGFFDDLSQVFWMTMTVPADTYSLIAEITDTTSNDLDMAVGLDTGDGLPEESEIVCQSATGTAYESCHIMEPDAGTWWVVVLNWEESANAPDPVTLATAVVPYTPVGNATVEGPTAVPELEPFDIRLFWDTPGAMEGDRFYGAVSLGTDAANPGNIGTIPVNLIRVEDDVVKTANVDAAQAGDVVTYTITVNPNTLPEEVTYMLTDTIPAGLTYVPGSASADIGTVDVVSDTLTWTGTMITESQYVMTTNADDASCDTPFGGYVNLQDFGILAQSGITGDTDAWTAFTTGDPIFYDGEFYTGMSFTDDGFAIVDVGNNYGGSPWTPQAIPNVDVPNGVLAAYWHDFEIFYDAAQNHGVSLATAGSPGGIILIEYDDIQLWGGSAPVMDFEIIVSRALDPAGPEIFFAYDNVQSTPSSTTIGLENVAGTDGVTLINDGDASGVVQDGLVVCFNYAGPAPVTITYAVTVDEDTGIGDTFVNTVASTTDNPGSTEESTSFTLGYMTYDLYLPLVWKD